MKFKKILVTGFSKAELSEKSQKELSKLSDNIVFSALDDPNLPKERADADCLLAKFNAVTKGDIQTSPNLKYIGVLSTGYGKVDVSFAKNKGVVVTNVPGYSTESVAEFVFAAILENLRDLERAKNQARKGDYSEASFKAGEIKGKNFGIIGLGRIGTRVAKLAQGFDANVSYWSKTRKKNLEKAGIKYQNLEDLISEADFLSLHLALNSQTENFLNQNLINKIKYGALIINTAPMELIDLSALEKRLDAKNITFILDHSDEMKPEDLKSLSQYKNCIVYPPIAYISEEAKDAKQEIFLQNIENFLKGKPTNVVN